MKIYKILIIFLFLTSFLFYSHFSQTREQYCDDSGFCYTDEIIHAFEQKIILNPVLIDGDPYKNAHDDSCGGLIPSSQDAVCALQYEPDRIKYRIATFDKESSAHDAGYIITHKGRCGTCSTLQDLSAYLAHRDLTTPVRKCSVYAAFKLKKSGIKCLEDLGFTRACAESWYYNALNTSSECFSTCVKSWIKNEPYNNADGSYNSCIECDEVKSGPVFKCSAGRTRRNSGIKSEINRPNEEVYKIRHDYY